MSRKALPVGTVMVLHALARGHRYGFDLLGTQYIDITLLLYGIEQTA